MRNGVGTAVRLGLRGRRKAWAWRGAAGPPVRAGAGGVPVDGRGEDCGGQLRKLAHSGAGFDVVEFFLLLQRCLEFITIDDRSNNRELTFRTATRFMRAYTSYLEFAYL